MNRTAIPGALVDGFLRLCEGDFSHRLPRTFQRDDEDAVAFFFNAVAEELDRIIRVSRDQEMKLAEAIEHLAEALNLVRRTESDFRALFDGAPVPLVLLDPNGTITAYNGRVASAMGAADGLVGATLSELFDDEEESMRVFGALQRTGRVDGIPARLRTANGAPQPCVVSANTIALRNGPMFLCSLGRG
jgi:PAS domain S-box-containing protein